MEIDRILSELRTERDRLDTAISALEGIDRSGSMPANRTSKKSSSNVVGIGVQKRRLSPAARRRISEAQKRRWAEQRKAA